MGNGELLRQLEPVLLLGHHQVQTTVQHRAVSPLLRSCMDLFQWESVFLGQSTTHRSDWHRLRPKIQVFGMSEAYPTTRQTTGYHDVSECKYIRRMPGGGIWWVEGGAGGGSRRSDCEAYSYCCRCSMSTLIPRHEASYSFCTFIASQVAPLESLMNHIPTVHLHHIWADSATLHLEWSIEASCAHSWARFGSVFYGPLDESIEMGYQFLIYRVSDASVPTLKSSRNRWLTEHQKNT